MQIDIGKTADNQAVKLDVAKLIDTRALVQGASGCGKSWLLRGIIEQVNKDLQVIVLDPEGEFATLREKLDMVLVGREGEVQTEPRAAGLLARKLKELRLSAVIDLYDLQLEDRRKFVMLFLESLMALPRSLWGPTLVVLDEAQKYCPERGSGDSKSTQAVIDLCSQGRKRGLAAVLVTQRLSKLHKDAAAELGNIFIGRTSLDIDAKRACDILGIPQGERQLLSRLDDGVFHGYGPAIGREVVTFHSRQVKTTHPKAGERHSIKPPKPSATIKGVLGEFANLAEKAAEEVKTLEDAKKRIGTLERDLRQAQKGQPKAAPIDPNQLALAEARGRANGRNDCAPEINQLRATLKAQVKSLTHICTLAGTIIKAAEPAADVPATSAAKPAGPVNRQTATPAVKPAPPARVPALPANGSAKSGMKKRGDQRMLIALAQNPDGMKLDRLSILVGMKNGSGTFGTYLSTLRVNGWIEEDAEIFRITAAGIEAAGSYDPLPTGDALRAHWREQLGEGGERRLFDAVCSVYPGEISRDDLAVAAELTPGSGTFGTYLSKLRKLGLVIVKANVTASEELFD